MVSAVRPATIRSTGPLWRGLARRSFAPCAGRAETSAVSALRRRPRHARVRSVDRRGAGAWRRIRGRQRHQRRRHTNARDRLRNAGDVVRCGHRHLGVAQSVRRQRHKGVLRQGREVYRDAREGSGSNCRRTDWAVPPAAVASFDHTNVVEEYISHTLLALPDPRGLRGAKIAIDTANGATTTVAPQLFAALGFDLRVPQCRAGRPEYQPQLRIDASRLPCHRPCVTADAGWASRSTATAIARSSRTRLAGSSTAMPSC